MVKHPGVWFARDDFSQAVPHEILCRQPAVMEEEKWRKARESDGWLVRPWQKQLIPNELAYLKQKDLHELGKQMSRVPGDFDKRYPDPDVGGKRSDDAEEEYHLEASVVLQKPEEKWLSNDYLILLRWKMKNIGVSKIILKKDKK